MTSTQQIDELTRTLQAMLVNLDKQSEELEAIAGITLEHFDEVQQCSRRLFGNTVEEFRKYVDCVAQFWKSYAKAIRSIPSGAGHDGIYLDGLTRHLRFHRVFVHRREGITYNALPEASRCIGASCPHFRGTRIMVAARMYWLQCRAQNSQEMLPATGRYASLNMDPVFLHENLPNSCKWLVDFTIYPSYESCLLLAEVHYNMDLRRAWEARQSDLADFVSEHHLAVIPDTKVFTTTPALAELEASDDTDCDICGFKLGPEYNEELETEPAIKTHCNHIFGESCLKSWIDTGHSTCPKCRASMYDFKLTLPEVAVPYYEVIQSTIFELDTLETEIDMLICRGRVEIYTTHERPNRVSFQVFNPMPIQTFLEKLTTLDSLLAYAIEDMGTEIQIEASLQNPGGQA
ncbi:hypothetical protein BDV95DRAFT_587531 [Massariosphaeria phaeospora]|uniref:RING-type domain-containing protein n=1 Tax=Massariosphaeria phaeospora TaxID=100035 RepID=A0A7C8M1G2_9PLEO|nr:hypothetical protein BDV95DRAFT_587531 [Massariosphaeria phaeospora]